MMPLSQWTKYRVWRKTRTGLAGPVVVLVELAPPAWNQLVGFLRAELVLLPQTDYN